MSTFNESDIQSCIEAHFPGDSIRVTGDGRHFEAVVVSDRFLDLRPLQRHRLVYDALGDHMREDVHALSIKALTPTEHNP
jgi:acid stress-induced BolA-like protein IbaG/YrbA